MGHRRLAFVGAMLLNGGGPGAKARIAARSPFLAFAALAAEAGFPREEDRPMRNGRVLLATVLLAAAAAPAAAFELGLPAACTLGEDCFVQNYPDLDPGSSVADPWCGGAASDGHDGIDIRIRSMADAARGVPVIAAADGVVKAVRDGVPDKLAMSETDRAAVVGIECGNGVVVDDGEGWETQYCHMRLGSVAVRQGQSVRRGDVLGMIGASGLAQFPHVHLAVRKDGGKIDPFTGKALDAGCGVDGAAPLWSADLQAPLAAEAAGAILDLGFSAAPLDYESLVVSGAPPAPDAASAAFVGWAWVANVRAGDQIALTITAADGSTFARAAQPLDGNKAVYAAFAGKRGAPGPGTYTLRAEVIRDGVGVVTAEKAITIQ
jgi:murein DD-endopeptidase MepM/ murein hydrolase activator NlpD